MWWSGGEGRVHTSGSPQLCFLREEKFTLNLISTRTLYSKWISHTAKRAHTLYAVIVSSCGVKRDEKKRLFCVKYQPNKFSESHFMIIISTVSILPSTVKKWKEFPASGWVWDLPPLFNRRYKVRPRKHGEQAVPIGWRRLIAGAGRVPLIGWPTAVYGLPEDTTRGGVGTVPVTLSIMC